MGVFSQDEITTEFCAAMTLRDCTVFVRFPADPEADIEARLGDLDLKSPDKVGYWRETEMLLIGEGWYAGEEVASQPLECLLSRGK